MTAHVLAASVIPARAQMGATLGFHIIFACFGIAMPAIVLIAHWRGLRHGDAVSLLLARRWSKVMAVLFAVGAVSGTVLSYELGLLWPKLMGIFGPAFGIPFSVEAIWFFVEAIFTAIYLYGWRRLPAWLHWWTGVPLVVSGVLGAFSVVAANSWMNQPSGFTLSHGRITHVVPSFAFLYWLQQHGRLEHDSASVQLRRAARTQDRPATAALATPASPARARATAGRRSRRASHHQDRARAPPGTMSPCLVGRPAHCLAAWRARSSPPPATTTVKKSGRQQSSQPSPQLVRPAHDTFEAGLAGTRSRERVRSRRASVGLRVQVPALSVREPAAGHARRKDLSE